MKFGDKTCINIALIAPLIVSTKVFAVTAAGPLPVFDFQAIIQAEQTAASTASIASDTADQLKALKNEVEKLADYKDYDVRDELQSLLAISKNSNLNFQQYHPGYVPTTDNSQNALLANNTMATLQNTADSMNENAKTSSKEEDDVNQIQAQASSAIGELQALQAETELTSGEIAQLQLLRQAVIAQTNAQVAAESYEIQKDASSQATLQAILANGDTNVSHGFGDDPLTMPTFK